LSSSWQALSSTPRNDTPSSSIVTQESSSSEKTISSSSSPTVQSSSSAIPNSSSAVPSSSSESPYFWNDEFDGSAIDTTKWIFEIGTGSSGWGNNEKEYYTDRSENAYVQDGILHIRANKEDYKGSSYTSARMITKGKFSFTYGTVEARIALPTGKGIWPAFWMLGANIDQVSWPACGEIDIIEAVNSESVVYGTNHWQYEGSHAEYGNNTNDFHGAKKALDITQFHTYKMTWDEKLIAMYVDDFKYHEISIENNAGGTDAFHKPQFFLLNVAVAGNWPGFDVDDTQFPNEMLVDYIRVSK
jgi:beta-glucanase (GH16 family)